MIPFSSVSPLLISDISGTSKSNFKTSDPAVGHRRQRCSLPGFLIKILFSIKILDPAKILDPIKILDTVKVLDPAKILDTIKILDLAKILDPLKILDALLFTFTSLSFNPGSRHCL